MAMQPGTTVNQRYEILAEIGRGGMGVVYRGRNIALDKQVAIKIFTGEMQAEQIARVRREAQALANVRHPNLVHVHALEEDENQKLMLVFDFIEGEPLNRVLSERKLSGKEIQHLFRQLCNGLDVLHSAKFVHRDIKPGNLMITTLVDGTLHLTIIDFGLAKSTENSQKLTATGMVMGTPPYMAPEQFEGGEATQQTDLYSAACVLYEMVAGRSPFDADSPYMVAFGHINEAVPALINNEPLNAFFQKALAKKPENRFKNASEMLAAFDTASGDTLEISAPATGKTRKPHSVRPKALIALCATLTICLFATWQYATWHQKEEKRALKQPDETIETEARAALTKERTLASAPMSDIVGSIRKHGKIAYESDRDFEAETKILTDAIKTLERRAHDSKSALGPEMAALYAEYGNHCMEDRKENKSKNMDAAIDSLQKAIQIERTLPNNKEVLARYLGDLADTYVVANRFGDAATAIEESAQLRGKKFSELQNVDAATYCKSMERLGNYQDVIDNFGDSLEQQEGQSQHWHGMRRTLGRAYIGTQRYEDAIRIMKLQKYDTENVTRETINGQHLDLPILMSATALAKKTAVLPDLLSAWGEDERTRHSELYNALLALDASNKHDKATAQKLLDRTLSSTERFERPRRERLNQYETWFHGLQVFGLCQEAAKRIGDPHRAAQCEAHIQNIKNKLIQAGCLPKET